MKKLISTISLSAFIFMLAPSFVQAQAIPTYAPVTININIQDQSGHPVIGRWFLQEGGEFGMQIRNGSSSESFDMDYGKYFLSLNPTSSMKAYLLVGNEPLRDIAPGDSTTYNVIYFKDLPEKTAYLAAPPASPLDPDVDVTPAPTTPAVDETEATPEEEAAAATAAELNAKPGPLVPETSAPGIIIQSVPTFETEPATGGGNVVTLANVPHLAATGAPMLALLLPSMMGSFFITRRKKQI
jgi:hypothetical protein